MALPFVFPSSTGPGRFTEVASFKKSAKDSSLLQESVDSAMHATSSFPPFRHCRLGDSVSQNGHQNTLLIFDWTSPAEKTSFEGQTGNTALETAKASWGQIIDHQAPLIKHHVILPGAATTPKCGYYETATLQIAPEQQYLVAQSMERYAHAIGEKVFNYLAVAVSIEDPGTLVFIMGYPDKETAEFADKSDQHIEAKKVNDPLVRGWWKSSSVLGQVFISK